jgi:glycerol kinase
VEHDAEEIYANTLKAVQTLLARHAEAKGELLALSITNQRETIVVFDKATGQPLITPSSGSAAGAIRTARRWKRSPTACGMCSA